MVNSYGLEETETAYRDLINEELVVPFYSVKTINDLRRLSIRALTLYSMMTDQDSIPKENPQRRRLESFIDRNLRVTARISGD